MNSEMKRTMSVGTVQVTCSITWSGVAPLAFLPLQVPLPLVPSAPPFEA